MNVIDVSEIFSSNYKSKEFHLLLIPPTTKEPPYVFLPTCRSNVYLLCHSVLLSSILCILDLVHRDSRNCNTFEHKGVNHLVIKSPDWQVLGELRSLSHG